MNATPSVLDRPAPTIALKLPARDTEALVEWLERGKAFRQHIHDSSSALRAIEKKRNLLSAEIAKLEERADEASAAEKIGPLKIQLAGVERKIEEQGAAEFIDPIKLLLSELTPIMRKAIAPIVDKEASRIAEHLIPYFRSAHKAQAAVRTSDWIVHLNTIFLNDWRMFRTLDGAIHCVESILKNELPHPYNPEPDQQDRYADTHSDWLKTSGRTLG